MKLRQSRTLGKRAVSPIIPDYSEYHTVLEPDRNEADYWAGAPAVLIDGEGVVWLACRMREGRSPRGERGYEIRILRSEDGIHFERIHSILREELGTVSVERPAFLIDPITGRYKLYICRSGKPDYPDWFILKLDDVDDPLKFDPKTARPVLRFPEGSGRGAKDPFVINIGGRYFMFHIGYGFEGRRELPFLATSADGENWVERPSPLMESEGWHTFFTRPACLMPLGPAFVLYYEGSGSDWFDPVYNIQGGVAVSLDLENFVDLTPNEPIFKTPTPGRYTTLRYTDYLCLEDRVIFYYEAARPNDSSELRATEVKLL
ncbi:MAG: hypothetical protein ACUVXI_16340 [bacterium]